MGGQVAPGSGVGPEPADGPGRGGALSRAPRKSMDVPHTLEPANGLVPAHCRRKLELLEVVGTVGRRKADG